MALLVLLMIYFLILKYGRISTEGVFATLGYHIQASKFASDKLEGMSDLSVVIGVHSTTS